MIELKIGTTPSECLACFELRHEIFVKKFNYFESPSPMVFDKYDALPNNHNLLALVDGRIVGTLRISFSIDSSYTPGEHYFDFSSIVQGSKYIMLSMLCSCSEDSSNHIAEWLIIYSYWLANLNEIEYVVACINPLIEPLFNKLGAKAATRPFRHKDFPQPILPIYIERKDYLSSIDKLVNLHTRLLTNHRLLVFPENELNLNSIHINGKVNYAPMTLQRKFRNASETHMGQGNQHAHGRAHAFHDGHFVQDKFTVSVKEDM